MKTKKRKHKHYAYRSAETGRFVSKEFAEDHEKTTVRETITKNIYDRKK